MNWADRVEAWLGRAWGGGPKSRRGGLQPVQIARALEARLLAGKRVSILRTYVPNFYRVYLTPRDWQDLKRIHRTLTLELVEYLREVAEREGCSFVSPPRIHWVVAARETAGRVRVEADFVEPGEPPEGGMLPTEAVLFDGDAGEEGEALGVEEEAGPAVTAAPAGRPEAAEIEPVEDGPAESTRRYRASPEPAEPSGRLVVVAGPDQGTVFRLEAREVVIGRAAGEESVADLELTDRSVSRRHARLLWRGGLWWLEDLGSTNGTYVNGDLIDSGWLQAGDRVSMGRSELVLEDEEAEGEEPVPS